MESKDLSQNIQTSPYIEVSSDDLMFLMQWAKKGVGFSTNGDREELERIEKRLRSRF